MLVIYEKLTSLLHLLLNLVALNVDVRAIGLCAPDEDGAGICVDGVGVHGHAACLLRPNRALIRKRLPLQLDKIIINIFVHLARH